MDFPNQTPVSQIWVTPDASVRDVLTMMDDGNIGNVVYVYFKSLCEKVYNYNNDIYIYLYTYMLSFKFLVLTCQLNTN